MKTPEQIFKNLFVDMNKSGIWSDAKAIADATPKNEPTFILAKYEPRIFRLLLKSGVIVIFANLIFLRNSYL